jgi:hypothetical protein
MSIQILLEPESKNNKSLDLYCNSLDANQLLVNGVPVGSSSTKALTDPIYLQLNLSGISTVFNPTGPDCEIQDITGCVDGQVVMFFSCRSTHSITIKDGFQIRTWNGLDCVLPSTGSVAIGVWSSFLGYMTITLGGGAP